MLPLESLLQLVAVYDLYLEQIDVKTACLHGELQEKVVISAVWKVIPSKEDLFAYKVSIWVEIVT